MKVGDWVSLAGRKVQVKSVDAKGEKVTLGSKGSFIPDETYSFERLNEIGDHEAPEGKFKEEEPKPAWEPKPEKPKPKPKPEKPDIMSTLKVGMSVEVAGQGGKVIDINSKNETISLDNGNTFSFGAVNKFGKVSEEKPKVEKKPKSKPKKLAKSKSILLKDEAKSVEEATKIVEDGGWIFDKKSDIFPNVKDYASHTPINVYTDNDGKIYGMAQYSAESSFEDEPVIGGIDYLEINTPMRGKGYGKRLMANILKDLLDRNCVEVRLTSLDANSNKFYEAIGMEPIQGDVYEGDAKWMKKFVKANT